MIKKSTFLFRGIREKVMLLFICSLAIFSGKLFAQSPNAKQAVKSYVTGVVSADGETLPGVTVKNKTASTAVITDIDGAYRIGVTGPNDVISFSYIGFQVVDKLVGAQEKINVTLTSASKELEDVVVVGYGSTRKRDVTGAIVSVTAEEIEKRIPTNIFEAIQGQAPGVQVVTGSGQPGESASVVIRGSSTMNDGGIGPLYVVDGVPTTNVDAINPYDVASVEILKDAASAAIYGSRSANGVIIITTKKGSQKAPIIEARYLHSINQLTHTMPQMNTQQYRAMQKGLIQYMNGEGSTLVPTLVKNVMASQMADSLNFLLNANNNYQDIAFNPAHKNQLDMSVGGGSEKLKYFIGGGYLGEKGIISNTSYDRISTRLNADYIANDKLTLGTRVSLSYGKKKGIDEGGFLNTLLGRKPNISLYYPDNTIIGVLWGSTPLALNTQTNFADTYNASFFQMAEYKINKDLTFTTNVNGVLSLYRYNYMRPTLLSESYLTNFGQHNSTMNWNWLNENYLNYTKSINNTHNFTGLLGVSAQSWRNEVDFYSGRNSATDAIYTQNAFAANFDLTKTGTTASAHTLASLFSRFTYNYKSRYLFTANFRADGSSRFARDKKVGYFPSASAAWRFSDEGFMQWTKRLKIYDAKLRVSYGITGNESIGDYESILSYGIGGIYDGISGVTASRISVDDLGWEETAQANVGMDLAFANNRFQVTLDYYNKVTSNLLAAYEIPKEWGFNTVRKNIGSITNRGLELGVTGDVIKNKNNNLKLAFNISANRNRVKEIASGIPYIFNDTWWISQGQPLGDFYGYKSLGIFAYDQSNAFSNNWEQLTPVFQRDASGEMIKDVNGKYQLAHYELNNAQYQGTVNQKTLPDGTPFRGGDVNWYDSPEDANGTGVITDKDRMVLGNAQPDFTGGINATFTHKNWSLFVSSYFSIGGEIYNAAKYNLVQGSMLAFSTVPPVDFLNNFWIQQGDEVAYGRPFTDRFQNARSVNSFYLEDASFVKIRNIRLSYTLPTKWAAKAKLRRVGVYTYVNNAFTFTGYSGYDPEFSA
ncbi:MAG: SusC/RagA family TonB-linked outer membrane protein, partial [Sphingobacteriales bacterium]